MVVMMTEYSSADLCKLSLQEVADLLLDHLASEGSEVTGCKVYGCCDGRMFELRLVMKEVKE
jgi:hypothetical protein